MRVSVEFHIDSATLEATLVDLQTEGLLSDEKRILLRLFVAKQLGDVGKVEISETSPQLARIDFERRPFSLIRQGHLAEGERNAAVLERIETLIHRALVHGR